MPKEQIRKRGRRKPKGEDEFASASAAAPAPAPAQYEAPAPKVEEAVAQQAGPSGLHPDRLALLAGHRPAPRPQVQEGEGGEKKEGGEEAQGPWGRTFGLVEEFPFGELDPDTKGYFKGLDDKIKDWQGSTVTVGEEREGELVETILLVRKANEQTDRTT
jgi:nucleolar protein 9